MRTIFFKDGDLVLPDRIETATALTVADGKVLELGGPAPPGAEVIDVSGRYVLPGLIDIHTHGRLAALGGDDLAERAARDARDAAAAGVTRFAPTLASAPAGQWLEAMEALSGFIKGPHDAAVPLGVHYEGIFLNPAAGGAHPGPLLAPFNRRDPDHRALFERFGESVVMVTFAPEVPGGEDLLEYCKEYGAVAALGHSAASPEEVRRFARAGVRHMTHLFNGMKPLHHRDPGPAAAGLAAEEISVDLICDGHHLHPEVVRLIHRAKAPDRRLLITDRVVLPFSGAGPGPEGPAGEDGPNLLPDGRFAGSRLRLCRAVKNYLDFTGCSLAEAVAMASLYPARLLGRDRELGGLEPGKAADVVVAGPGLEIEQVFVSGQRVH